MSAIVEPAKLAEVVAEHGLAYLLTVSADGRPNISAVGTRVEGPDVIVEGAGARTRTNLQRSGQATLLWPPRLDGGYSLIVDGDIADPAAELLRVRVARAVRHRPAAPEGAAEETPGAGICGSDCLPVGL